MSKISHLLEIVIMLQYKDLTTASELADILKVDKKTIYRYINSLVDANIPVKTKKGRYGGFYIDKGFYIKNPELTTQELQSLLMASYILTKQNGFSYEKELNSAVAKINSISINSSNKLKEQHNENEFNINHLINLEMFDDNIAKINYAMSKGRTISIDYFSLNMNSLTYRKLDPYTILFKEGAWHLIGYCHLKKEVITFEISRIKKIKITDSIYMKPVNFLLKEYLNNSWGIFNGNEIEVNIKFNKNISNYIKETRWHPNQEIIKQEDGSILFKALVDDLGEIKNWVLGFGEKAEVIAPMKLRNEIKKEVYSLFHSYGNNE